MISLPFGLISCLALFELEVLGKMKVMVVLSAVECITNLLLDLLFVGVLGMGTAGARAFYGESHKYWFDDEVWEFHTDNVFKGSNSSGPDNNRIHTYKYAIPFTVLELTPCHILNGDDESDYNNPFFAFDYVSLIDGVSDMIGPVFESELIEKPLTSVDLASGSYTYTGKYIKPKVTVKAGKDTVPSSGKIIAIRTFTVIMELHDLYLISAGFLCSITDF